MLYISRRGLKSAVDWYISWLIMTIDDVINAKKLDFITKVYRQGEYTQIFFRIFLEFFFIWLFKKISEPTLV